MSYKPIPILSTQIWWQTPQGKGSVLPSPQLSDASRKPKLVLVLLTNNKSWAPTTLSSVQLVAHRPQRKRCLLDHRFIPEAITQAQQDRRDAQRKVWGRDKELPCPLQTGHSPQMSMGFTNPEALWTQSSWVFMAASLHRHD